VEWDVHRDLLSKRIAAISLSRDFGATFGRAAFWVQLNYLKEANQFSSYYLKETEL
jgi:hypothetical protein